MASAHFVSTHRVSVGNLLMTKLDVIPVAHTERK
jgi:hypothetical protein